MSLFLPSAVQVWGDLQDSLIKMAPADHMFSEVSRRVPGTSCPLPPGGEGLGKALYFDWLPVDRVRLWDPCPLGDVGRQMTYQYLTPYRGK